ncbi:hypothetical protein COB64_01540 [Candidatus Wolfebacteria bacterium]|nr:MAG: hypothetical protein COB64_01540 [Candidatus Wolfebacteria bacterium]
MDLSPNHSEQEDNESRLHRLLKHSKQTRNQLLLAVIGLCLVAALVVFMDQAAEATGLIVVALLVTPFLIYEHWHCKKLRKEIHSKKGHIELG